MQSGIQILSSGRYNIWISMSGSVYDNTAINIGFRLYKSSTIYSDYMVYKNVTPTQGSTGCNITHFIPNLWIDAGYYIRPFMNVTNASTASLASYVLSVSN